VLPRLELRHAHEYWPAAHTDNAARTGVFSTRPCPTHAATSSSCTKPPTHHHLQAHRAVSSANAHVPSAKHSPEQQASLLVQAASTSKQSAGRPALTQAPTSCVGTCASTLWHTARWSGVLPDQGTHSRCH
jgi:hypothetical protein